MKRYNHLLFAFFLSFILSGCYTQLVVMEPVYREPKLVPSEEGEVVLSDKEVPEYDDENYTAGYYEGFYEGSLQYRDLSYRPSWLSYSSGPWDSFYPSFYFPSYYYGPTWSIGYSWYMPGWHFGISAGFYNDYYRYYPYNFNYGFGYNPWYYDWYYRPGWWGRPYTDVVFVDLERDYRYGRRSSGVDRSNEMGSGTKNTKRRFDPSDSGVSRSAANPGSVKPVPGSSGESRSRGTVGTSSGTSRSSSGTVRSSSPTRSSGSSGTVRSSGSEKTKSSGTVRSSGSSGSKSPNSGNVRSSGSNSSRSSSSGTVRSSGSGNSGSSSSGTVRSSGSSRTGSSSSSETKNR